MHYIYNLFIEPGDELDKRIAAAMAPQEEGLPGNAEDTNHEVKRGWNYQSGEWDWYVVGGRWDGYFGGDRNLVTAGELVSGEMEGEFEVPFGFITLPTWEKEVEQSRQWHKKSIYIPQGFWSPEGYAGRVEGYGLDYFFKAPYYEEHFNTYLGSVPSDTLVVAIDVHC